MPKVRAERVRPVDGRMSEDEVRWLLIEESDDCRPLLCLTEKDMEELIDSILQQQQRKKHNEMYQRRRRDDDGL